MVQGVNSINSFHFQVGSTARAPCPGSSNSPPANAPPEDRVTLSAQAKQSRSKSAGGTGGQETLSAEEKQQINELKKRDAEVKAHEQAHMAAGGGLVQGGASYQYQRGPDGKMYAVGGEVKIDVSPERTPEGTIRKMQQVKGAALAPAQPSGTDRAVAARAAQIEAQARGQMTKERQEETEKSDQTDTQADSPETSDPMGFPTESQSPSHRVTASQAAPPEKSTGRNINIVA
ncbi:MAG: hypothetical protein HKP58_20250 [Desulfatitalea sp.]|nr:hypothetical protein [Desulfatitalea sp.]NNK02750.1 hypothetical protein [Desulfatitalea sp.]